MLNVQNGIFFSIISFYYCILITFIYFSKKKINSKENKTYGILLITTLIGLFIEIFPATYAIKFLLKQNYGLSILILKLILAYFIIWISIFTYYVNLISVKEEKRSKNFLQKGKVILIIIAIISILFVYILPLNAKNNHGAAYTYGPAANFVYLYSIVLILYWFILLFKNIKNILHKKYYPIFTFIILGIVVMMIQYQYPELTLMISMQTFVICFMYFTIENPDIQMLRELHKAREYVENSNNEKSLFLFKVTQRLREPLKNINRLSKEAIMEPNIEVIKEKLQEIKYSSNSSLALVNDVLDISELENRKIKVEHHKYQPVNLFHSLSKGIKLNLKNKNIEFRYNYDGSIPEYLTGDSLRIKQIVSTILENAVTHTEEGFIEFTVNAIVKYDTCRLIIIIEDSGKGMTSEQINHIFKKEKVDVYENHEIDDSQKNLSFTKTLVDLIGGTITINSEIGRGTKFTIVIDQKITERKNTEIVKAVEQYEKAYVKGNRVLMVTTDEKTEKKVISILKKQQIRYETVKSGQECLEKIRRKEAYDLILMDEELPKLSSVHTLEKLREIDGFHTPIVLMSKHKDIETKDTYINIGFGDIIEIPIHREDVKLILEKYLK